MKSLYSFHYYQEYTPKKPWADPVVISEGDFEHPDKLTIRNPGDPVDRPQEVVLGYTQYVRDSSGAFYWGSEYFGPWSTSGLDTLFYIEGWSTTRLELRGDEIVDGRPCTKVVLYPGEPYTKGAYVEIWVDRDTNFVLKVFQHPEEKSPPTTMTLYSRFNEPVVPPIQRPNAPIREPQG